MRTNHLRTNSSLFKESLMGSDCFAMRQVGVISDIRPYGGFFMNYKKNYDDYIAYVKTLNRVKLNRSDPNYIYYGKHHIIPTCMGGVDGESNLVLLTTREHVLAHYLLTKIFPSNVRVSMAFFWMTCQNSSHSRNFSGVSSKIISIARENNCPSCSLEVRQKISQSLKGKPSWNLGVPHSEETKRKIGMKNLGYKHTDASRQLMSFLGKNRKQSDETKKKLSLILKGRVFSDETRRRMSIANTKSWLSGRKAYNGKPVVCLESGIIYDSISSAVKGTGVSSIKQLCKWQY